VLLVESHSSYYCHPLRHAAIVAIESSAARDRRLFPNNESSREKYLELDHESPSTSSPLKRQKTVSATVSLPTFDLLHLFKEFGL